MKKWMRGVVGLAVVGLVGGCTKVPPGYEGILVNNWGTQRGVQDLPIKTGRVTYNPFTTDVHRFPVFARNYVFTADKRGGSDTDESISFNSDKGVPIDADIGLIVKCKVGSSPKLFLAYRMDIDGLIHGVVWNEVRDAFQRHASRMNVMDIIGPGKATLLDSVKVTLNRGPLSDAGLEFVDVTFVSDLRLDETVMASINSVIRQQADADRAEAKVRETEALALQKGALAKGFADSLLTVAEAQAEANRLVTASLTRELIEYTKAQKWDGVLPRVNAGQGSGMFLQVGER